MVEIILKVWYFSAKSNVSNSYENLLQQFGNLYFVASYLISKIALGRKVPNF